jgi:hypothetical protein
MNLEPYIWGPHYWATMHFMSSTYDNKPNQSIKTIMKNFIQSVPVKNVKIMHLNLSTQFSWIK